MEVRFRAFLRDAPRLWTGIRIGSGAQVGVREGGQGCCGRAGREVGVVMRLLLWRFRLPR